MQREFQAYYESPVGLIDISSTEDAITGVNFIDERVYTKEVSLILPDILKNCIAELEEYFAGTRSRFSVNTHLQGTDFQVKVWRELMKIPYGETVSYMEIARSLGNERAVRAVGNANKHNKISILIPCHRVTGSNGSLIGYAGGLWRKEYLLRLEKRLGSYLE